MDKGTMGLIISIVMPVLILQAKEMVDAHKHRRDLALQQARRDEVITSSIDQLKSTTDKSQAVLQNLSNDIHEVRERLIRVETRINP
ncbi:MAG: hypothetical protein V7L31_23095 [Nostoc sp.]